MPNPAGAFIWYELMTPDPDGARAFYGAVVGWTISGPPAAGGLDEPGGMDYRLISRDDGGSAGGVLALTPEMRDGGARPMWMGYLHVADVDAAVSAIVAEGGRAMMAPFTIEVGRIAMVLDPQGVPIYIMTPIPPADNPDATSDVYDREAPQRVSWNELITPDVDGAKAFYARHFNFAFNDSMPMGEMGDYWFIDHGGQQIGAMMRTPPQGFDSLWRYYIRVASIDAAMAAVAANGGQVLAGPMEVPGGDWIINGVDPQGAAFALVGAKGQ